MKQATTRTLFSYWDGLRGERAAPERGEIDPGAIRHVLADTFILEVGGGLSGTFRLAGTRLCALFGLELKGMPFNGLWPGDPDEARHLLAPVTEDASGVVAGLVGETGNTSRIDLELLLLPLRHAGKPHTRVLGALAPATLPVWLGMEPVVRLTITSQRIVRTSRQPWVVVTESAPLPAGVAATGRRFVVHQGGRR